MALADQPRRVFSPSDVFAISPSSPLQLTAMSALSANVGSWGGDGDRFRGGGGGGDGDRAGSSGFGVLVRKRRIPFLGGGCGFVSGSSSIEATDESSLRSELSSSMVTARRLRVRWLRVAGGG